MYAMPNSAHGRPRASASALQHSLKFQREKFLPHQALSKSAIPVVEGVRVSGRKPTCRRITHISEMFTRIGGSLILDSDVSEESRRAVLCMGSTLYELALPAGMYHTYPKIVGYLVGYLAGFQPSHMQQATSARAVEESTVMLPEH
ncbi:hypothetical protein SCUP234_02144 [Seiridium cupressi]